MDRTAAINALRQTKIFRNTSFRLLSDLIERAENASGQAKSAPDADTPLVIVLDDADGDVAVGPRAVQIAERRDTLRVVQRPHRIGPSRKVNLPHLAVNEEFLAEIGRASFSLYASLDLDGWADASPARALRETRQHTIWVCEQGGLRAPLEAMTHVLAASVARDFGEPVAIVTWRGRHTELAVWDDGKFVSVLTRGRIGPGAVRNALATRRLPFCHVFHVHPAQPERIPPAFAALRFHRVVYVTDSVPSEIPAECERAIVPEARNPANPYAPYFSSFVASVVQGSRRSSPPRPFSEPIVEEEEDVGTPEHVAARRVNRDLCRIHFDVESLRQRWKEARIEARGSFAAGFLDGKQSEKTIASRWARAVTNRRVGLALSGGGASSYRMVALVESLEDEGVPLDLVSGVSGGTLVGAYYCKDGRRGLQRCVENGLRFQLLLFGAMLDSRLIRWQVDWDLESARVEDLEVRLVAVTTALKRGRRPDAHAVCAGTLGEAVQASGAAPGLFSPTERRDGPRGRMTRYTDGYLCRLIPARVLPDYGADLVIAFNTIAGPRRRNPFGGWEIGEFLYSKTPVGRFIDFWVSQAFLLERCSDEVAEDAHLFIEPLPDDEPLLEALRFAQARQIVEQARAPLRKEVERCVDLWRRFRVNPAFRPGENAAASRSRPRKGAK